MKTFKTTTAVARAPSSLRLLALQVLLAAAPVRADNLWDLSLADLGSIRVTTLASGTQTPLDKAAAIATVITAEDIEAIGATDIDQVLETVPGLHITRSDQAYSPKFVIRGITSTYNAQALMLINGIPVSSLFLGNRSNIWAGMPVKAVSRIEVIRGPGSALYGADAYAGVINIITKDSNEISGLKAGARRGSFDTAAAWLQYGVTLKNGLDAALSLEVETTDGWKETVRSDRQSVYDQLMGTNASLAPGAVDTMKDMVEARLDIAGEHTRFRAGYQGRYNVGSGVGYFEALDHDGRTRSQRINADYSGHWNTADGAWLFEPRISYFMGTQEVGKNLRLLPRGTVFPLNGLLFADGLIGNPGNREENARLDLGALFKGFDAHYIRLGAGFVWSDMREVTETKNFTPAFTPRPGGIEDVSDTPEVYLPEQERQNSYVYAQDEWKISTRWQLTSGLRYDHYSDFGNAVNPRMALVWAPRDGMTTRLLYGRAFRAPSFAELFVTSNPINLGNPDLKPETIDTYELAFSHQSTPRLQYTANIYRYNIQDMITFVPITPPFIQAQNVSKRKGHGLELEADYSPNYNLRFLGNYAWQKSEDRATGADVGEAPGQKAYLRSEWLFLPDWHLDSQLTWVGKQKRAATDSRPALDDYTTVDVTLRKRDVLQNLSLALSVRNLTDADVREPSPGPGPTLPVPAIPDDFPMAGRSLWVEGQYQF